VRYGQDMTTEPTDPRPIMRRLWKLSKIEAPVVLAHAGVFEDDDASRYSSMRRVLSGVLYGTPQEVGALLTALAALDDGPLRHQCRVEYVRVYCEWKEAEKLAALARQHGVIL